jgi:hypothetical protein
VVAERAATMPNDEQVSSQTRCRIGLDFFEIANGKLLRRAPTLLPTLLDYVLKRRTCLSASS